MRGLFFYFHDSHRRHARQTSIESRIAVFILKAIMHAKAESCFDHDTLSTGNIYFAAVHRQMGIAVSPGHIVDQCADILKTGTNCAFVQRVSAD